MQSVAYSILNNKQDAEDAAMETMEYICEHADDFVDYIGIFNSLKDGMSKVADWFKAPVEANELTANLNEMIKLEEDNGK